MRDKCSSEMSWLDNNTLAEKEEFEDHLKDCQRVCGPIMSKMHGAGDAGQKPQGQGARSGPTVEEVD